MFNQGCFGAYDWVGITYVISFIYQYHSHPLQKHLSHLHLFLLPIPTLLYFLSILYVLITSINSNTMELEDAHRLQRQLHSYHSHNQQLTQENKELRQENDRLNERVSELEKIVANQPINLIRQQVDPLAVSNSLAQLEDRVAAQAYQMKYLKQMMEDKSMMLAQAQSLKNQLEVTLQEKDLELSLLRHQIKEGALRQDKSSKQVEMWKHKLERANQERLKLINEKEEISKRLKREQGRNHNDLSQLGKDIVSIKQSAGKQHSKANSNINTVLQSILTVQQNELHDRNREITKLKAINGTYADSNEVQNLKNTIKHLRGEITRYSSIVQHVTEKLAIAEKAVQNYSDSVEKCLEERAAFAQFNERIEKLQALKGLQQDLLKKTEDLQAQKKAKMELKKNLVELLYENQGLHQFLSESFGHRYEQRLNQQIKFYKERCIARSNSGRWGSIDELFSVNDNLRKKLKLK